VEEKSSIKAREREEAPTPAASEERVKVTQLYKRQGALQLFAALSVA
jgi:hypothetical protein